MEKYKIYVSIVNQQVYYHPDDSPWEFEVDVEREYIPVFHRLFKQIYELEFRNFLRSHLPFMPYHYGRNNYKVDERTMRLYALIHEFTDENTKRFIEELPYFVDRNAVQR
ncbi:MAG: transposase [Sporosarcina sp.]